MKIDRNTRRQIAKVLGLATPALIIPHSAIHLPERPALVRAANLDLPSIDRLSPQAQRRAFGTFPSMFMTPAASGVAFGTLLGTLSVSAASIPNPAVATGSAVVSVGDGVYALMTQVSNLHLTAVADNLGNTYVSEADLGIDAGSVTSKLFYSRVTVAGTLTSVSGTTTAGPNNYCFLCAAFAGPFAAPPIDASPAAISTDVTSPYTCPATGVLAQADELIIAFFGGTSVSVIPTATAPLTIAISSNTGAAGPIGVLAYQVVAATTSVAPEFVEATNASSDVGLGTCSFKKAA